MRYIYDNTYIPFIEKIGNWVSRADRNRYKFALLFHCILLVTLVTVRANYWLTPHHKYNPIQSYPIPRHNSPARVVPFVLAYEVPHISPAIIVVDAQVHVSPGLYLPPPMLDCGKRNDDKKGPLLSLRAGEHVVQSRHHLSPLFTSEGWVLIYKPSCACYHIQHDPDDNKLLYRVRLKYLFWRESLLYWNY